MLFTNYLVLAGATLAAAIPADQAKRVPHQFSITHFSYGCTAGCFWKFEVTVQGDGPHHPTVSNPVTCSGTLDNTDYVDCGNISNRQTLRAYIEKATNKLKLQYEVQGPEKDRVSYYTGERKVYAATSKQAKLQKSSFIVPESSSTGVA